MKVKDRIEDVISKEMPFLAKIKIESCKFCPSNFITGQLLPYLFFTNTSDSNYRIIPLFLNRKEDIELLPLFYSLALFNSYSKNFLKLNKFSDVQFGHNAPTIRALDSSVVMIEAINYSAQNFVIRSGRGQKDFVDFSQIPWYERQNKGTGYYRATEEYFNSISNFNNRFKVKENPLELLSFMDDEEFVYSNKYQAAVFYTNDLSLLKTDFYRDFTINKKTFFKTIPACIMDYNHPNYNFISTYDRKAQSKMKSEMKEFLIFSHFKNYRSFDEIKKNKSWISTIIFDFTKDLKEVENVLDLIKNDYSERLVTGEIKDIYLVFNEKDIDIGYKIIDKALTIHPFLLNHNQKLHFTGQTETVKYNVEQVNEFDRNKDFQLLFMLANELCKEVHIIKLYKDLLVVLFEIKTRYYSFYQKDLLENQIEKLEEFITYLRKNVLTNPNLSYTFNQLYTILETIRKNLCNEKFKVLRNIFKGAGKVLIVSFNSNLDDFKYLKKEFGDNDIVFINPKELKHPLNDLIKYDEVYIINSNKELRYLAVLNKLCKNVTFILTKEEAYILEKVEKSSLIKQFANDLRLLDILNLQYPDEMFSSSPIENQLSEKQKIEEDHININEMFDLDGFVKNIISENSNNSIYRAYKEKDIENVIIVFKDETSLIVSESKYFFIYKENINTLKDCHVQAKDLENEDMVFLLRHDSGEFEKLLWEVASLNSELKEFLEKDRKWRIAINNYIIENKITPHEFCVKLKNVGFQISSAAVLTWIKNDIIEPQGLRKLLDSLFKLKIISEDEIDDYLKIIKTVKILKTRLPYELKKIHVADLNDISYHTDYEFRELIEKMYQFMDIKTVSLVIKQ